MLSRGRGTPDKGDLIHIAVSFKPEDYDRLGTTAEERKEQLREVARQAMGEMMRELRAREMQWVAGIHLNTAHPHVHIVIHKEVIDLVTGKPRRMGKIPKDLLPYRETRSDGSTRPVEGHIGGHFVASLDRHIERVREPIKRKIEPERERKEKTHLREWLRHEAWARATDDSWDARGKAADEAQLRQDRAMLGEAMEKNLRREYAALDYERALQRGDTFRFRVQDASTGGERQISEADVRRRADARGSRAATEHSPRSSIERQHIRQGLS